MSTVFKTCTRLTSFVKSHLVHDIRYSYISCCASNTNSLINLHHHTKHQFSRFGSSRNSPQKDQQDSVEEDTEDDETEDDTDDDTEDIEAANENEEELEEDGAEDSEEEIDDEPKELSVKKTESIIFNAQNREKNYIYY